MRKLDYVEGQGIHHEAIAECIGESGMSPADVARATGTYGAPRPAAPA